MSVRDAEPPTVLPRGRHAAPRHVVEASQRARLLEAMASAVARQGYAATSVADVLGAAGVGRRSFYEHFTNKEDCFLQAFELGVERLLGAIEDAVDAAPDPVTAAGAGVRGYLTCLRDNPDFARTYLIEVLAAGPRALERRSAVHARFEAQLRRVHDAARAAIPQLPAVPGHRFEACVAAIDGLVFEHVRVHGAGGILELEDAVLDIVVAMLVGHDLFARLSAG